MAILLPYQALTPEQGELIAVLIEQFQGEVSQCSLRGKSAQVVLNDTQITPERGQEFLDRLIEIVRPNRWGTDLPIGFPERAQPPEVYASRYRFEIPYDPFLVR